GDPPPAAVLHVAILIHARHAHAAVLALVQQVVVQRPGAARAGRSCQLDLRVVAVMEPHCPPLGGERATQEPEDRLPPSEAVAAAAVADSGVRGEAVRELVPPLEVERPKVPVLQLPNRLQLLERPDAGLQLLERRHAGLLSDPRISLTAPVP